MQEDDPGSLLVSLKGDVDQLREHAHYDTVFRCIGDAVVSLTYRWKIYCELFDSGADNLALLNASGANVFGLLQAFALDDAILALSRLTDPATSGRPPKDNASFHYLIAIADSVQAPSTISAARTLLTKLKGCVKDIRSHRNKAVAHPDLAHAVDPSLLPPIGYDTLEAAMQLSRELVLELGTPGLHFTGFDTIIPFGKGPSTLLAQLRLAVER